LIALLLTIVMSQPCKASELKRAKATAYCLKGKTATGTELTSTTDRRVVASKREYFGKLMYIWIDDGSHVPSPDRFLGIYTVEDTGSESIRKGYVVDVFVPDYNEAIQFGSKDIIYQVVDANG